MPKKFTEALVVPKINEIFEKILKLNNPDFLKKLIAFHGHLSKTYACQSEHQKAFECLATIVARYKEIIRLAQILSMQIIEPRKQPTARSYRSVLLTIFNSEAFADLMRPILDLQLQSLRGSDYQEHLLPMLEIMPAADQEILQELQREIGNMPRFYPMIKLCLTDIGEEDMPSDLVRAINRITTLAGRNNEGITTGQVPIAPKIYTGEGRKITGFVTFFDAQPTDIRKPSGQKGVEIQGRVAQVIKDMKLGNEKYQDTRLITTKINEIKKDQDIPRLKMELLRELRSHKYDYLRQCGILGFFTRYRTHDTKEKTSASWNSIETLLVSPKPDIKYNSLPV